MRKKSRVSAAEKALAEMNSQFRQVEDEFALLKEKYTQNKISEQEFRTQLRKLRIRDGEGHCWTIGARTGKWYFFDGDEWVESQPPSVQEGKAICIYCGFENELTSETCQHCGGRVKESVPLAEDVEESPPDEVRKITPGFAQKFDLSQVDKFHDDTTEDKPGLGEGELRSDFFIKALSPVSSLLFFGIGGLFLGMIFGVFVGTTHFFSDVNAAMPAFLLRLHGQLIRGVLFGLLGGAVGFGLLAGVGLCLGLLINMVLYFMGGLRIRISRP